MYQAARGRDSTGHMSDVVVYGAVTFEMDRRQRLRPHSKPCPLLAKEQVAAPAERSGRAIVTGQRLSGLRACPDSSEPENLLMKARQDTARFCCGV
jgi:hypothetical protein